jgi:hypothetical protein
MSHPGRLFLSNIPRRCSEEYLMKWIEARSYRVFKVSLVRDVISGTSSSFAYVQLMNESKLAEAARVLNGQNIDQQTISVETVASDPSAVTPLTWMKVAG